LIDGKMIPDRALRIHQETPPEKAKSFFQYPAKFMTLVVPPIFATVVGAYIVVNFVNPKSADRSGLQAAVPTISAPTTSDPVERPAADVSDPKQNSSPRPAIVSLPELKPKAVVAPPVDVEGASAKPAAITKNDNVQAAPAERPVQKRRIEPHRMSAPAPYSIAREPAPAPPVSPPVATVEAPAVAVAGKPPIVPAAPIDALGLARTALERLEAKDAPEATKNVDMQASPAAPAFSEPKSPEPVFIAPVQVPVLPPPVIVSDPIQARPAIIRQGYPVPETRHGGYHDDDRPVPPADIPD
jgi:hypothetical protein